MKLINRCLLLFCLLHLSLVGFSQSDNCNTATVINLNNGTNCVNGTTINATSDNILYGGCNVNPVNEVWYTYVSTGSQNDFTVTCNGITELEIVIDIDGCGNGTFETCNTATGTNTLTQGWGVPAGTQVWIMIASNGGVEGDFEFCVDSYDPSAGNGNACIGAIPVCDVNQTYTVPDISAYQSSGWTANCFGSPPTQDIWYQFTVTQTGLLEWVATPLGAGIELDWALLDITSGCPGTLVACNYNFTSYASAPAGMLTGASCAVCPTGGAPFLPCGEYCDPVTVIAGNTYAIQIDNYTATPSTGLDFDFGPGMTALIGPVVDYTISPNSVTCGSSVTVSISDNSIGGTPDWTFGNGNTYSGNSPPDQTYTTPGTYAITAMITDPNGCTSIQTEYVNLYGPIVATTSSQDAGCSACDGQASVTATGGDGVYSYLWNNGATTPAVSNLCAGTYNVTVYNSVCNATVVETVTINSTGSLNYTLSGIDPLCNGGTDGSVTANVSVGTAPLTYSWSTTPVQTNATATGLSDGTYSVTVTDATGCTNTISYTINEPQTMGLVFSSADANCGLADGSIDVTTSGGTPGYTYSWSSGCNTSSCTGLAAGAYTVTVTDLNGCTEIGSYAVGNSAGPTGLMTDSTAVTCYGGADGTATVLVTDGTFPYTYSWSTIPVQTNSSATGLSGGLNSVSVIDANGCSTVITVQVDEPPQIAITITSSDPNCNSSNDGFATANPSGGTPGYAYSWNTSPAQTTQSAAGLSGSSYTVTVTDNLGCNTTQTVSLTAPTALTYTITENPTSCGNACDGSASINAFGGTPPYDYSWNTVPIQTTQAADSLCAGTHVITLTDTNGCTISATATITSPGSITASISSSSDVTCYGLSNGFVQSAVAGGITPYTYIWNNNQPTDNLANLVAGTYILTVTDYNGCSDTTSIIIIEPPDLIVNATQINASCFNACDGMGIASVSGGTLPYSYQWNSAPFQITDTAANLCGNSFYNVTVTDNNGCYKTDLIYVSEPNELLVSSAPVSSTCGYANGSACLTPSGGVLPYSYSWSISDTTACIDSVLAGVYNPVVTDGNGCTDTTVVIINDIVGPAIDSVVASDVLCYGDLGTAEVFLSGGTGNLTYEWRDNGVVFGINSNIAFGLSGGNNYTVTVYDINGCIYSHAFSIYEPLPITSFIVNPNDPKCFGSCDGTAQVIAGNGTPPYAYNWVQSGSISDTTSGLCSGVNNVIVTDTNGCFIQDAVTLYDPPELLVSETIISVSCNGGGDGEIGINASGGTAPYTYLWSPSGSGVLATNLSSGSYNVSVSDSKGCMTVGTYTVPEPSVLVATGTTTPSSCGNDNGEATVNPSGGTGPYSYEWFNGIVPIGQTTQIATGLMQGSYDVEITDAYGCQFTLTLMVWDNAGPSITSANANHVSCYGGNDGYATVYHSGGTLPFTYLWSDNQTTDSAIALSSGTYTVIVSDLNGCLDSTTVTVSEPLELLLVTSPDTTICVSGTANLSALATGGSGSPYTYSWDNSLPDTTSYDVAPLMNTLYNVTVTDTNNCQSTGSVMVDLYPPLSVNVDDITICAGDTGDLSALISGGSGLSPTYTYQWNNSSTSSSIGVTPSSSNIYNVTVSDGCSPDATTTVNVTVNQLPVVDFSWSCDATPYMLQFSDSSTTQTGDYIEIWSWDFGDGSFSSEQNPFHSYAVSQVYGVSLVVTTDKGCTDSLSLSVQSQPTAVFTFMQNGSAIDPPEISTLSPTIDLVDGSSLDVTQWEWDFNSDNTADTTVQVPDFQSGGSIGQTYSEQGVYYVTLTVTNANGCIDTALHPLYVIGEYVLFAPNTFIPSSLIEENQFFKPQIIGVEDNEFRIYIYNRWGDQVYEYHDTYSSWPGWDGRANKKPDSKFNVKDVSQTDVYVWLIRVEDINGDFHEYLGHVTLLR